MSEEIRQGRGRTNAQQQRNTDNNRNHYRDRAGIPRDQEVREQASLRGWSEAAKLERRRSKQREYNKRYREKLRLQKEAERQAMNQNHPNPFNTAPVQVPVGSRAGNLQANQLHPNHSSASQATHQSPFVGSETPILQWTPTGFQNVNHQGGGVDPSLTAASNQSFHSATTGRQLFPEAASSNTIVSTPNQNLDRSAVDRALLSPLGNGKYRQARDAEDKKNFEAKQQQLRDQGEVVHTEHDDAVLNMLQRQTGEATTLLGGYHQKQLEVLEGQLKRKLANIEQAKERHEDERLATVIVVTSDPHQPSPAGVHTEQNTSAKRQRTPDGYVPRTNQAAGIVPSPNRPPPKTACPPMHVDRDDSTTTPTTQVTGAGFNSTPGAGFSIGSGGQRSTGKPRARRSGGRSVRRS